MKRQKRCIGLEDLPEECIAHVVSQTSPVDACRLALVSPTLRSAAGSDAVWDSFLLLSDYMSIISQSNDVSLLSSSLLSSTSKKDLFYRLSHHPLLIENAKKSFWLDKWSGKKCYMIAARELEITRSEIPQNWTWPSLPESRFKEAAELLIARRLEIRGKIDTAMLSPATNYAAYLVFKWRRNAYGFTGLPTQVAMGVSGSMLWTSTVCLSPDFKQQPDFGIRRSPAFANLNCLQELQCPRKRKDGWMEIELGDYFNDKGDDGELKMGIVELTGAKAGLIVQGIEIRPKRLMINLYT